MHFYDLADFEADVNLTRRLGYKLIFKNGDKLKLSDRPEPHIKTIVSSGRSQILIKALREQSTIGIAFADQQPDGKVIASAAEADKPIFFVTAPLFSNNRKETQRSLYNSRRLFLQAKKAGVRTGIITFARSKEQLLSTMQLIEMAKLMGADDTEAKQMVGRLGDIL